MIPRSSLIAPFIGTINFHHSHFMMALFLISIMFPIQTWIYSLILYLRSFFRFVLKTFAFEFFEPTEHVTCKVTSANKTLLLHNIKHGLKYKITRTAVWRYFMHSGGSTRIPSYHCNAIYRHTMTISRVMHGIKCHGGRYSGITVPQTLPEPCFVLF